MSEMPNYYETLPMLRLVEPAPIYKSVILAAVPEMHAIGEWNVTPDAFAARFDDMLREIAAAKDPATAPPGVLPYEDFWLMDNATVVKMHYQAGRFVGAYVPPTAVLPRYRAARDAAWQAAIPFGEYWEAHPQYWRDRHTAAGRA